MGSVYNRGTRAKPNWYVSYKDSTGKRRAVPSRQPTKMTARRFLEQIEARIANGQIGYTPAQESSCCAPLLDEWMDSLRNRTAVRDRANIRRTLVPEFGDRRLGDITLPVVMRWLDRQRASGRLADSTIRKNLGLLSRFFSWAIERGLADVNPVRQIPVGKRPKTSRKADIPWLDDETLVRRIIDALPEPSNYLFYLGNRSGIRKGELISLRLSDFDFLGEGVIRVRYSHDGPLKEDKDEIGKSKWVPAADDCAAFLGPWLARRREAGAAAEEHAFPSRANTLFSTNTLKRHWTKVRAQLGVELTWYQATRHSFASRLIAAGVPLGEVADALGHSSPAITRRYYDHFIRRSYSPSLRGGLDLGAVAPTTDARGTASESSDK